MHLAFDNCSRGIRMMTGTNEMLCSYLATILALKYSLVASSMSQYITGNLDTNLAISRTKLVYGVLMLAIGVTYLFYLVKSVKIT